MKLPKPLQRLVDDVYPSTTGIMIILLLNLTTAFLHLAYPSLFFIFLMVVWTFVIFLLSKHILEQCVDIVEGYKESVEVEKVIEEPIDHPTIRIGDYDVPQPSLVRPEDGQFFWVPFDDGNVKKYKWNGVEFDGVQGYEGSFKQLQDEKLFSDYPIHLNQKSAQIHADALKSLKEL